MKPYVRNTLAATALAISTIGMAFGAAPSNQALNDVVSSVVVEGNVQASVEGSVVTLTGNADASSSDSLEMKIGSMDGVTEVINLIATE